MSTDTENPVAGTSQLLVLEGLPEAENEGVKVAKVNLNKLDENSAVLTVFVTPLSL